MYLDIQHFGVLLALAFVLAAAFYHADLHRRALAEARHLTRRHGLTLLDESIILAKIRIDKRLRMLRIYRFEFSSLGDRRYRGELTLRGKQVIRSELEPFKVAVEVERLQ